MLLYFLLVEAINYDYLGQLFCHSEAIFIYGIYSHIVQMGWGGITFPACVLYGLTIFLLCEGEKRAVKQQTTVATVFHQHHRSPNVDRKRHGLH